MMDMSTTRTRPKILHNVTLVLRSGTKTLQFETFSVFDSDEILVLRNK